MIRVALARTEPSYAGIRPPYSPGKVYPELAGLLGGLTDATAPNPVYAGVRASLIALGLDEERVGSEDWNPLGTLVHRGGSVVLKPNFIRHWNPLAGESVESVITHGGVLRAIADFAFLATGPEGSVSIAEAPQMDCDFERIREATGLDELVRFYDLLGLELDVIDLRREAVRFDDGIVVSRRELPGDPLGYRAIDLAELSFFHGSGLEPQRMRGADYDPNPTVEHHQAGRNEYLLSETVLSADLVVNLPKLKTHKKRGVTLAFKNLVGINGDKNWLPHHCVGSVAEGGDEYPDDRFLDRLRSRATGIARPFLQRGRGVSLFRLARRLEGATRGDSFIRAGNWYGNQTTWRMCLDLNRCLYYSDANGLHKGAAAPVRKVLTVLDGIVAGENEGPLAPLARPLGVVIAGLDPLGVDLVAVRLMGFDESRIPKLRAAMADDKLRITEVRDPDDVSVSEIDSISLDRLERRLCEIEIDANRPFIAHPGWRGRIERVTG